MAQLLRGLWLFVLLSAGMADDLNDANVLLINARGSIKSGGKNVSRIMKRDEDEVDMSGRIPTNETWSPKVWRLAWVNFALATVCCATVGSHVCVSMTARFAET